ncbi:uncharacterized protein LOC130047571 [Ostrea edulis]|uniref:uncharacterized protein LOC130047571 n=1 Tax=Ostrea edulis TaxID=37623 RepID=UPI0024AF661E|nr:uncharacterized protein LOC130047571 [Ostrea edulis]
MFHDKRTQLGDDSYNMRTGLAICHWNENVDRQSTGTYQYPTGKTKRILGCARRKEADRIKKKLFSDLDAGAKTPEEEGTRRMHVTINPLIEEYGVSLPETDKETEWVHVQTLTKDQVFGLQYVMFDKDKQQPSFVVISNGAEVVQISRTLYLSKLDFNARERLRSEVSPYPTDEELQHNLITRVNWEAYKDIVLQQIADDTARRRPTTRGAKHRPMRFKLAKSPSAKSVYS